MICVSLAEQTLNGYLMSLQGVDFAEIRLDMTDLTVPEVTQLFSVHPRLIATCRPGPFPDDHRRGLLIAAIAGGAAYVDVEVDSEAAYREGILAMARSRGCTIIVSFHDYEKTPRSGRPRDDPCCMFQSRGGYCEDRMYGPFGARQRPPPRPPRPQ